MPLYMNKNASLRPLVKVQQVSQKEEPILLEAMTFAVQLDEYV